MKQVHAKAPLRLGLAGGGTDVSPYSDLYGGRVLNATISLYTHCSIRNGSGDRTTLAAADFEEETQVPLAAALPEPESTLRLHRAVYERVCGQYLNGGRPPIHVTTYSDAPPGSGVGSSSALVVAMVKAYTEFFQLPLGEYDLAHLAYEIERIDCQLAGGKQDHYAAAFGGFNFMEFGAEDRVIVNPLRLRRELANELEARLLLFYTGRSRESAKIIESQILSSQSSDGEALSAMHRLKSAAEEMKDALLRGRIGDVLDILGASWHSKKLAASGISNPHIETIAQTALAAGASALKISGAGGGGFMMIAADPAKRHDVMRALDGHGGRFYNFSFVSEGAESWICR